MVPFPQHRTALAAIVTGLVTILAAGRALSQEPIPALDLDDPQKAVVVELHFTDFSTVEVEDTDVVFGVPPALLGNPPLLGVKIFDLEGGVVEAFDTWHPLYSFTETEDGGEELELLDGASAPVTFPLRPDVATMEVTDLETEEILISVDLIPAVHRFCREERDDRTARTSRTGRRSAVPGGHTGQNARVPPRRSRSLWTEPGRRIRIRILCHLSGRGRAMA